MRGPQEGSPQPGNGCGLALAAGTLSPAGGGLPSHRKRDETYPVLVRLDDNSRIINCRDDMQWILQRRTGPAWRSVSYFRNRDVLIERSRAQGEALASLRVLPAMHP